MATILDIMATLEIEYDIIKIGGIRYLITTGTGETSGPEHCFGYVYDKRDLPALDEVETYSDFCLAVDAEDDRDVAIALAARGLRMLSPGSCVPILADGEYALIRQAIESV